MTVDRPSAFDRQTCDKCVVRSFRCAAAQCGENPTSLDARLSPDGKWLAWIAPSDGVLNLWVAGSDDLANARVVTSEVGRPIEHYDWGPDSRTLLYINDKGGDENYRLYSVDVARALAVDPDLPRALAAKGMVLHNEEGARLIERAVATDPDDVDIWRWAANARHRRNDFAGAFAAHARAASLDPTSRQMAGTYVQYALFMGRADLAQAAIARFARASDPAAVRVLRIYTTMYSGRLGEAATLSVFVLRDGGADANRAATELAKAIDEGWRGQGSWTEVDPIDDPVCVGVARDARFAAQRARRAMLVAAERPAVHRATTAAIAWLDANPLPQPQDPPR